MKIKWHNSKKRVDDLIPFEKNPRKISDKQKKELTESLEKFDLVEIPAIDTDNKIIAGHQRLEVLKLLGRGKEEIDVRVPNRKLTKEEFEEYNLRSNKNTAEWDIELLADFDIGMLEDIGFDSVELDEIFPPEPDEKDDEVPEVPKKPKSKMGDIYELPTGNGNFHRIMAGDSTKREDVEKLMNGVKADCVFTDPPYALFGNSTGVAGITDDKMTRPFFLEVFRMAKLFTKLFAHIYTCCDWHSAFSLQGMAREMELKEKNLCIWDKGNGGIGGAYQNCYEMIWFHSNSPVAKKTMGIQKTGERTVNGKPNIWRYTRENKNRIHNAQKPVDLIVNAVENSSDKNDIVLDLFLGSGSTLIACEKTNRTCYGCELDLKYIDVIIQRYCDYTENKEIIKNGKKIIWK